MLENALRHETGLFHYNGDANVLILILLENALRQLADYDTSALQKVLILILLENALRRHKIMTTKIIVIGLNPYFVGKCSTALCSR